MYVYSDGCTCSFSKSALFPPTQVYEQICIRTCALKRQVTYGVRSFDYYFFNRRVYRIKIFIFRSYFYPKFYAKDMPTRLHQFSLQILSILQEILRVFQKIFGAFLMFLRFRDFRCISKALRTFWNLMMYFRRSQRILYVQNSQYSSKIIETYILEILGDFQKFFIQLRSHQCMLGIFTFKRILCTS